MPRPGREIGVLADAPVELERRRDLATNRRRCCSHSSASVLATLIDDDEAEVDGDLGQLRALVAHRQDRTAERFEERLQCRLAAAARVGAADDEALGLASRAPRRGRRPASRPGSRGSAGRGARA